ncbi:response regulator transcription factor [Sutcliffiella horikoshii]|uniref:response regulator transcription factor n=1 Tax=Sutcliffiella horikoshii TaxID=79883 RepID=UPI001F48E432|nr:response regulator transcription factor [Sutcliffiella horikoshii]MCG1023240.1 response regulator transcription factor [Sutcliffiella horikoshii]
MTRILMIDDEKRMLDLLTLYLTPYQFECFQYQSGMEAITFLEKEEVDIVLLDVMMPTMDGWETLKVIRKTSNVPVIMLTARNDKDDIVKGLKSGADDYVSKPFDEDELIARIEAVMRRTKPVDTNHYSLRFKGLVLNTSSFHVQYNGEKISVTPKEFAILETFLLNQDKVFSRDHLIVSLWEFDAETENRTIDSHIRNLRSKLRKAGFEVDKYLETIWGVGYRWNDQYEGK